MEKLTYSLKEFASLTGKSTNLIHRRLSEKDSTYEVRFARKEGGAWIFDKSKIDTALHNNEVLIIKKTSRIIDENTALEYFSTKSRSCWPISVI